MQIDTLTLKPHRYFIPSEAGIKSKAKNPYEDI